MPGQRPSQKSCPEFNPELFPDIIERVMEKKIYLEPKFLDDNFKTHLQHKIQSQSVGQCDPDYGYILSVRDKFKIIRNYISSTQPGTFFQVRFKVQTLKPKIGSIYQGKVCLVFAGGLFLEVADRIKILIPADRIDGYKYDSTTLSFSKKKGKKTISIAKDSIVSTCISTIKFDNQNFSCIGELASV